MTCFGRRTQRGFTLIEMIITIVIFAVAMLILSRFLFPQIALSAQPHYQARAAALANAMMSEILARKFDANSDDNGEQIRCDDTQDLQGKVINNPCSLNLVATTDRQQFSSVDDYIGCWQGKSAHCDGGNGRALSNALGDSIAADYSHFTVTVAVFYDNNLTNTPNPIAAETPHNYKRINMVVDSGRYGRYQFAAYRGNY
ncbi:prepilin-type N-terminal cleavage/methylation domain-containing protein [Photobacterium kishitanii]|uniref:type IV pilus modification PilV family protein n=1 Tax=Photobacterium kishitanii TaxID=318456 RepID=UPI00071AEDF7|nr:prepilin-type N-terminal cleavage/methylation domain-containing protein [Photobacterium kishitanii]